MYIFILSYNIEKRGFWPKWLKLVVDHYCGDPESFLMISLITALSFLDMVVILLFSSASTVMNLIALDIVMRKGILLTNMMSMHTVCLLKVEQ